MFESITGSLRNVFRKIVGQAKLTEANVGEAMEEVRLALLEADVNLHVVRTFTERVREKALGLELIPNVNPGDLFVKVVHDELVTLLGGERQPINWQAKGAVTRIMLCGLQGSGKTTTAGKLALRWKNEGHKPLLVAADVQRPAAIEQLRVLAGQVGVPIYAVNNSIPVDICKQAGEVAKLHQCDVIIYDTAGRLHIDDALMSELEAIVKVTQPQEILFVCDAMIGQSAVDTASEFKKRLPLTGAVMTKLDSDARGGSALSLREATGVCIKYATVGEKLADLDEFHPSRMAGRILGMGDVVSLVERAQSAIDEKDSLELQRSLLDNTYSLEDFRKQLEMIRKMGRLRDIAKMIPGLGSMICDMDFDDSEIDSINAMLQSMTLKERQRPEIINASRQRRIAKGSGHTVQDVTALMKQFVEMKKIVGRMGKAGLVGGGMKAMQSLMSGGFGNMLGSSKKAGTKIQQKDKKQIRKERKKEKKKRRK